MIFRNCLIVICHIMFYSIYGGVDDYQTRLMELKSKFDSIKDYNCLFESFSSNEEKSEAVTFRYFYKKPKSVRMEIIEGSYSGTILLYEGKNVRVKPGVFLIGWFTFNYSPDHKYVCDYRGNGLHNSDWGYFIQEHINLLELTTAKLTGEETLDGRKVLVYELLSKDPSKSRDIAKEKIWIDKDQNLLIRYRQYDSSGRLIQSGYYKDIKIDSGINNSVFTNF